MVNKHVVWHGNGAFLSPPSAALPRCGLRVSSAAFRSLTGKNAAGVCTAAMSTTTCPTSTTTTRPSPMGPTSRRRDCSFDTPCLSLLKHRLHVQGGAIKLTVSPAARNYSVAVQAFPGDVRAAMPQCRNTAITFPCSPASAHPTRAQPRTPTLTQNTKHKTRTCELVYTKRTRTRTQNTHWFARPLCRAHPRRGGRQDGGGECAVPVVHRFRVPTNGNGAGVRSPCSKHRTSSSMMALIISCLMPQLAVSSCGAGGRHSARD